MVKVLLNDIAKARKFVSESEKFDADVDIVSGRYKINAKSIMGVFSLDLSIPVYIDFSSRDDYEVEEFNEFIKEFACE